MHATDLPHSASLPPPSNRAWTAAEKKSLLALLLKLSAEVEHDVDIAKGEWAGLAGRLGTQKAVERYQRAAHYAEDQESEALSYRQWLLRVVKGYYRYHDDINGQLETPDGALPALQPKIEKMAYRGYLRVFHYPPSPDHKQMIVSATLQALAESYYYDVALDPWLYRTSYRIILNDLRQVMRENAVDDIEQVTPGALPARSRDDVEAILLRNRLLAAIEEVSNQRYRVVLLLVYIYQLNNTELAAFFGVTVPRVTIWLARARAALRKIYRSDDDDPA